MEFLPLLAFNELWGACKGIIDKGWKSQHFLNSTRGKSDQNTQSRKQISFELCLGKAVASQGFPRVPPQSAHRVKAWHQTGGATKQCDWSMETMPRAKPIRNSLLNDLSGDGPI